MYRSFAHSVPPLVCFTERTELLDLPTFDTTHLVFALMGFVVAVALGYWLLRPRLPERAAWLELDGAARRFAPELLGGLSLVAIGSYGANQLLRLLLLLEACGLERVVGSILIVENDAQLLEQFKRRLPRVFATCVVYAYCERYTGGQGNRDFAAVVSEIDFWGPPIKEAAEALVELHERRTGSRAPSSILVWWSLGGQAPMGMAALPTITQRWASVLCVAFAALPIHERLRDHLPVLKQIYDKMGVIAWILADNLSPDQELLDAAAVALVEGLADAAISAERAPALNNTLRLALQRPGSVLVYQVAASKVVAFPTGYWIFRKFYVFLQPIREQILATIRAVDRGEGAWSLTGLPLGSHDASTFDLSLTSLYHADLQRLAATIADGRAMAAQVTRDHLNGSLHCTSATSPATSAHGDHYAGPRFAQPNYEHLFGSIVSVAAEPARVVCPVLAIRLTCVADGDRLIEEIAKSPERRLLRLASRSLGTPAATANGRPAPEEALVAPPATNTTPEGEC